MKKIKTLYTSNTLRSEKITLLPAICFLILSFLFSCGHKETENSIVAPEGMISLDLSRYGKPFSIFIPDTAKTHLYIDEQSNGALNIKVGEKYAISINEQAADLELLKKDLKEDEVNKLKSFIKEEPNALIWESSIVQPEFHFFLNQKIGNSDYSFEDIKDTEANPFNKDDIQKMYDAGKNIQVIKKETNS